MKVTHPFGLLAVLVLAVPSWAQAPADPEPPSSLSPKARIAPAEPITRIFQALDTGSWSHYTEESA